MYDVIIIGKGPAGCSAALYTIRANLKTLMIGMDESVLRKAAMIENYYGLAEPVSGQSLLEIGEQQISKLGGEMLTAEVFGIEWMDTFEVITSNGNYQAKTVLIATGQPQKQMKIENIITYEGKGISYCTTCDGFFYKNRKVGVVGNKDFAVHEASSLQNFSTDVTLYTNGLQLDISAENTEVVKAFHVNDKKIARFEGNASLETIVFADDSTETVAGLFIANESASSVDFAKKLGVMTVGNDITVDPTQQTNLPGLYAAGDCTGGFKQISTAVGQGAMAARSMIAFVKKMR
ncbi:MAG: NAD(P)/FAD-dependent oxidoreductase [Hyphomonadaceae bacterium]|nr:NAD(P)/FAD-dependent oxidoreductase [Clostridia bacterium]